MKTVQNLPADAAQNPVDPAHNVVELEPGFPAEVRAELRRVLASPQFDASERNHRFLAYVVEEALAGRGDRIKAYSVATTVFGRDESFDPQLDPVVRMEAGRLRRSLERLYLVENNVGSLRIMLPKGGYVPTFRKTAPSQHKTDAGNPSVAIGNAAHRGPSIMVSAFEAEGECEAAEKYCAGFVRQIVVGLARFPEFAVFTADASMASGGQPGAMTVESAADVDLVLSGGIAISADIVSVKATLVDARSGRVVWADEFEQCNGPEGTLAARDNIANSMVRLLAGQGTAIVNDYFCIPAKDRCGASFESLVHFNLYRRALRKDLFLIAREHLDRALQVDPAYSETAACLSRIFSDGHRFGFASEKPADLKARSLELARLALEFSPVSSRAYHAQGIALWCAGDADASISALLTAVSLNPNASDARLDLGLFSCFRGDWDNGMRMLDEAVAGNAAQPGIQHLGRSLYFFRSGHFDRALAEAKLIGLPHLTCGFEAQAMALSRLGRRCEAHEAVARILSINPRYVLPLEEFAQGMLDPALAKEFASALRDAGLARVSAVA